MILNPKLFLRNWFINLCQIGQATSTVAQHEEGYSSQAKLRATVNTQAVLV